MLPLSNTTNTGDVGRANPTGTATTKIIAAV